MKIHKITKSEHFSLKWKFKKYTKYVSFAQNETGNLNAMEPNMQTSREQIKLSWTRMGFYRHPRNSTAIAVLL